MAGTYAKDTSVSQEKSRSEIEATLRRYGATSFYYASEQTAAMIGFKISDRMIKFILTMPDPKSREFTHHSRGERTASAAHEAWEQAGRQRWRALALVIKAKLEAVSAGITTVEDEFLAHTVLADGQTVGDAMRPQLEEHYRIGGPPSLMLPGPGGVS